MGLKRNLTDGRVVISDGTRTFSIVGPGDLATSINKEIEAYLDHGELPTDGSGVRLADEEPAESGFSAYIDDYADGVNIHSLLMWWHGGTSSAISGASLASTTTRDMDSERTLDVLFYPEGSGASKPLWTLADCLLTNWDQGQGRPNPCVVTVKSTTSPRPVFSITAP